MDVEIVRGMSMEVEVAHFNRKIWGHTAQVMAHPVFEVHHIRGKAGGFCSKHQHVHKHNHFHVISGEICVRVWWPDKNPDKPDKRHLLRGQGVTIPPGVKHQFEVIQDCEVIETYWAGVDHDDIIREYEGGMHASQAETYATD